MQSPQRTEYHLALDAEVIGLRGGNPKGVMVYG
jgi:hypothetical protein